MGLGIRLYNGDKRIEEKSDHYPTNEWHKGYLASAYSPSSFNAVVGKILGKELHYVFDPIDGEEDEHGEWVHPIYPKVHLRQALVRAKEVQKELGETIPFNVASFSHWKPLEMTTLEPIQSVYSSDAYRAFKENWKPNKTAPSLEAFDWFNTEVLLVHAAIIGLNEEHLPTLFIVTKSEGKSVVLSFPYANGQDSMHGDLPRFSSNEDVLSIYEDHQTDNPEKNYSCHDGYFYFHTPLLMHGVVAGADAFNQPALHLIHQVSEYFFRDYKEQAEIIVEFIEKALTLEQPRIVWSA